MTTIRTFSLAHETIDGEKAYAMLMNDLLACLLYTSPSPRD